MYRIPYEHQCNDQYKDQHEACITFYINTNVMNSTETNMKNNAKTNTKTNIKTNNVCHYGGVLSYHNDVGVGNHSNTTSP
jgi:hypothetical protein